MITNEREFDNLMLLLNFTEHYDTSNVLCYRRAMLLIYQVCFYKYDSEIEIKNMFIDIPDLTVRKYSFEDGIKEIKKDFQKELRAHKISKLLSDEKY